MKNRLVILTSLLLLVFASCKKDKLLTDYGAKLEFSLDTVIFDTVFTTVGSVTKQLKIYNPHSQPIEISEIRMAGMKDSHFRMNVDGYQGPLVEDIEIKANDSIFVFVEVTVDPNNTNQPMVIQDSIIFTTNGLEQDIDLVAWGQDAYFWPTVIFETGFAYTLPTDKPNVFYGWALVDSAAMLIIAEGTQIHFHKGSGMLIYKEATLKVNGTVENPVVIQGDRLEWDYRDIPGQWNRIWLYATSRDNVIKNTIIKNGNIGIQVDTIGTSLEGLPTLTLENVRVENMSGVGLLAQGSEVVATNSLFSNCGQYACALAYGGNYTFTHCTFANYWKYGSRSEGMLLLNNNYESASGADVVRDFNATFNNSIIYGNKDEEIQVDLMEGAQKDYLFNYCLLKTEEDTDVPAHYNMIIKNTGSITVDGEVRDGVFDDPSELKFNLFDQSSALNQGSTLFSLPTDIIGNARDAQPDMGAFEFVP